MSLRSDTRIVVEGTETFWGQAFDYAVIILIVVSLISLSVETLPGISADLAKALFWIEVVTVGVFTAEYLLRVWVADRPARFVFSVYGLIDLLAILPFYLGLAIDLRSIRVLRLLRMVRLLKLLRYSAAMVRFRRSLILVREELILFGLIALGLLWLASVGIYYFERDAQPERFASVFHSLWWAVATLTTVGYGDVYPVTVGGRIFTFFILMIGLGVIAVPTGIITSALTQIRASTEDESGNNQENP